MSLIVQLAERAKQDCLRISGAFTVRPEDGLPEWARSVALLSPDEPRFWPHFIESQEWRDQVTDPMDRWSERIIGAMADDLDGVPLFPFSGPPYRPFYNWALRGGQAFVSPVSLLADAQAGLFGSYRGAIALRDMIELPPTAPPCDTCIDQPCLSACPAAALTRKGYDVPSCHDYLDEPDGAECMTGGCLVRRACPVGADARSPQQSAYHMGRFHR